MERRYYSSSCESRHHHRVRKMSRSNSAPPRRFDNGGDSRHHRGRSSEYRYYNDGDHGRTLELQYHHHRRGRSRKKHHHRSRRSGPSCDDDDDNYDDSSCRKSESRRRRGSSRRHRKSSRSSRYRTETDEYSSKHRRRRSEKSRSRKRKKKRRRREERKRSRRHRHHRNRSYSRSRSRSSLSESPSIQSPPAPREAARRRTGVVSEDEPDNNNVKTETKLVSQKTQSAGSASSRDDTVGHFRGGPGTIVAERYKVTRDVGLGTFGRVVECLDLRRKRNNLNNNHDNRRGAENKYVAIKIVRDVKRYYQSAIIEANILEEVNRRGGGGGRGVSHCVLMHDAFTWNSHFCMVFESLGPSLYDFLKRHNYQPFPMICIKDFTKQLLEALEFLHSFRLIHTDLKPENILLVNYREVPYKIHGRTYMIPESTKIKLIDFGGATYDDEKKSSVVNTRQYRAPEVILGLGWSMPSDLWSAGCILAELYLGELLLATHDNQEHLALIERVIGPFPIRMLKHAKNFQLVKEGFDENGRHRLGRVLSPESASYVSNMTSLESTIQPEDRRFLELLRMLLVINPNERATAQECVRHRLYGGGGGGGGGGGDSSSFSCSALCFR